MTPCTLTLPEPQGKPSRVPVVPQIGETATGLGLGDGEGLGDGDELGYSDGLLDGVVIS